MGPHFARTRQVNLPCVPHHARCRKIWPLPIGSAHAAPRSGMKSGRTVIERTASAERAAMSAPAAAAKDLNDGADLGLIKRSDWHGLHGRDQGQAGARDEGGGDKLFHDDVSSVDMSTADGLGGPVGRMRLLRHPAYW